MIYQNDRSEITVPDLVIWAVHNLGFALGTLGRRVMRRVSSILLISNDIIEA